MYESLIDGTLGSPGLVDNSFTLLSSPSDFTPYWSVIRSLSLNSFLPWVIDLMHQLITWITSTPLVMTVIAIFFAGFVFSIFARIYHSC